MNEANWLFGLGVVVASAISAFLGAYIKRKGEDFAAQQGIEKLTATVENIKAAISDDVWDRQKQWEMKRDIVFEMVRSLGALHYSLIDLEAAYSVQVPNKKELDSAYAAQVPNLINTEISFKECNAKVFCAMYLTRLITGEELCKKLTELTNQMRILSIQIRNGNSSILYESKTREALRDGIKAVLSLARKELNIQFDFQELDSID